MPQQSISDVGPSDMLPLRGLRRKRACPSADAPTTTNAGNQIVQRRAFSQTVAIVSASWAPLSTNMALERR
jgi:hypothetical protein